MTPDALLAAVLAAAESLPPAAVETLARSAEINAIDLGAGLAHSQFRSHADSVRAAWQEQPEVPGAQVAAMLRAAAGARLAVVSVATLDVVWTGPSSYVVPSRTTEAVVLDVIAAARKHLLLVTYAAYRHAPLIAALKAAANRGVDTTLVVETVEGAGKLLAVEPAKAFEGLSRVRLFEWPVKMRMTDNLPGPGRLHAKMVVADRDQALVTSANLTGSGIEDNIECGLLVRGGPIPGRLVDHIAALTRDGVFRPLAHTPQSP